MSLKLGSFIKLNDFMSTNEYIQSPNLLFFAMMQDDGNFCVYRGTGPRDHYTCLWATNSMTPGGQFFAIMEDNGNFCVYKGTGPNDSHGLVWPPAKKMWPGGRFFANMQDDGNFCVYNGTGPNDSHGCIWATMKMIYMDDNIKQNVNIIKNKTLEIFKSVSGMSLPDGAGSLHLVDYQPVVFGIKRVVGPSSSSSPARSLSDELSNRFYWILKSYWSSTGGLPGKSESQTIDKFMKAVEIIWEKIVEQQSGAHLCSALIEGHLIASIAVLLDVAPQNYVGIESDLLLSIAIVAFRPKEGDRHIILTHLDNSQLYKYIQVNWPD